jgi:hypothetical protein
MYTCWHFSQFDKPGWVQWLLVPNKPQWNLVYLAVLAGLASPAGSLRCLQVFSDRAAGISVAAVASLTSLTALHITAGRVVLYPDVWAAIGSLSRLRQLALRTPNGDDLPRHSHAGLVLCTLRCEVPCSC